MKLDEKVLSRLEELIADGEAVLRTAHRSEGYISGELDIDSSLAHQWVTSVSNLLGRVLGKDSEHYVRFCEVTKFLNFVATVSNALGILRAAREDFKHDRLFDIRLRIEAEVFDDFLGQAEYLLAGGYYQPAAVIAGAVLEDGLRKVCIKRSIALSDKPKLDQMNADLAKAGQFNVLVQKRITALADLRNKAAHGQWDQFKKEDVAEMIPAVRRILAENLTA